MPQIELLFCDAQWEIGSPNARNAAMRQLTAEDSLPSARLHFFAVNDKEATACQYRHYPVRILLKSQELPDDIDELLLPLTPSLPALRLFYQNGPKAIK